MKKFQNIEIRDRLHTSYNYNKVSCPDGATSVNNRERDETPAIIRSMCTATAGDGSDATEMKALFNFKYLVGNSRYLNINFIISKYPVVREMHGDICCETAFTKY